MIADARNNNFNNDNLENAEWLIEKDCPYNDKDYANYIKLTKKQNNHNQYNVGDNYFKGMGANNFQTRNNHYNPADDSLYY